MTRRLRIVLFAPHFAEYASRLALGLARDAEVLLFLDRRNAAQECDADLMAAVRARVKVVEFGSIGRSERVRALLSVMARTTAFAPDVFHIQEQVDKLTLWVARFAARFHRLCLTVHDPRPHTGSDSVYAAENAANREIIRGVSHAFHVHGSFCRGELTGVIGTGRPVLDTPHGVLLVPGPGENVAPEPGRVLMFGRMEAYKGLECLLDAAQILADRQVAFRLVLAGRGPELSRLSGRIAGARHIELIEGFLEAPMARREIGRACFVVAPYSNATQSGVVSASFGGGRPVVASRVGGLADAVIDGVNGVLVSPSDPVRLADALEAVLHDAALRARLAEGAAESARGPFNWEHIAAQMLAFHRERLIREG